jgi:hypothetical protein
MTPLVNCIAVGLILACVSIPARPPQTPASAAVGPAGTYKLKIGGKSVGWERFEISKQNDVYNLTSTGQLTAEGVAQAISTTAEIRGNRPAHYSIDVKSGARPRKYTIDFSAGHANAAIEYAGKVGRRAVTVHDDTVLLDRNVWYQYMFLFSRYDMANKGVQSFNVFIAHPTLREYTALVEFQEATTVKRHGQKILANRFGVELGGGFQLLATADQSGLPLEIEIPAQDETISLE